jgi:hypothetical protein
MTVKPNGQIFHFLFFILYGNNDSYDQFENKWPLKVNKYTSNKSLHCAIWPSKNVAARLFTRYSI